METTLIRFKRKKSSNNEDVQLQSGEPYYNLADKKLFIGDSNESLSDKKHVAEVTETSSASNVVSFSVGEASDNIYIKEVDNVEHAVNAQEADRSASLILSEDFFGDEAKRAALADKFGGTIPVGTVFFQEVD